MSKAHQNEFDFVVEYAKDAIVPSVVENYLFNSSSLWTEENRTLIDEIGGSIIGSDIRHTNGHSIDSEQFEEKVVIKEE
jgi:hypothetical protein